VNKAEYDRRRAQGVCVWCKSSPRPGRAQCADCSAYTTKLRAARFKRWRDAGLCSQCGKIPCEPGYAKCLTCLDYYRAYCRRTKHASTIKWQANNPEKCKHTRRGVNQRCKAEVLAHYGGVCACCGESELAFLSIDHINGGGTAHRKRLHSKGWGSFHRWLKNQGYPEGYRVLCLNCNMAVAFGRVCPHQVQLNAVAELCISSC
jgi:hypothetical protein